jgi:putative MATE family efflux protein
LDRSNVLLEKSVGSLLLEFSIPAIVGMVVNALYIVIDRIFIGNVVGAFAISGVSLTFPIGILIIAFALLIGIGAAACISIRLGQSKRDEAENILGNAFVLLIISSVLVTVLGLVFMDSILFSFGASANTIEYAREFITIILAGCIFQIVGFGLNNIIRAEGNPKMAMVTMLIGAILNIILDYIFIVLFHFGIKGAATATVISQGVVLIWVLSYFMGDKCLLKLKPKYFRLSKNLVLSIFAIGMSPFVMQVAASAVNIVLNKSLAIYGGDLAIGAMGIINSVVTMILMPVFGVNQGSQPIIGYNYGAGRYDRVKKALKLSAIAATTMTTIGWIIVELFPTLLVKMFNSSDAVLTQIGVHGIRIYLIMLPLIGFQIVSANFFQSIGRAKISMFIALLRQVIVLIPMILILPIFFKINGVWISAPVSDFIAAVVASMFLILEVRKLKVNKVPENLDQNSI